VLDIEMPNLNGYDLLSILHAYPELTRVKIVMLTSRSSEKHQARALELGAHAYLTKPCPQDTLLETIENVLSR
jgi:DNA-binding response OmpR family regulator